MRCLLVFLLPACALCALLFVQVNTICANIADCFPGSETCDRIHVDIYDEARHWAIVMALPSCRRDAGHARNRVQGRWTCELPGEYAVHGVG